MPKNVYQAIRAHVSGEYRTDTLHGKEYIIVPVVALVEGVLQGMAAEGPELALASEFGRFPAAWDGRPLVMSHPLNDSGLPVSANSPKVLEAYQIGFLFNSSVGNKQLQLEAWVDPDLVANLNEDSKSIFETLQKGEMIEVSTGYFAMIEQTSGLHNNQKYDGIQRDIVPDHLAFLPNGTVGACSNKDGCGAQLAVNSSPEAKFVAVKDFRTEVGACCDSCAQGGTCEDKDHPKTNTSGEDANKAKEEGPEAHQELTIANTISGAVLFNDARDLVTQALQLATGSQYIYIVGMTADKVIYENYNQMTGVYNKFQRGYTVSAAGKATLSDDVEQVNLITKVVVVNSTTESDDASGNQEQSMTDNTKETGKAPAAPAATTTTEEAKKPRVDTVTNEQGTLEINFDADGKAVGFKLTPKVQEAKKPATTEEFIAQAPKEMQEVLNSSLKLHNDRKQSTIKALKDSGRCKFSDEYLAIQSLDTLESLAELASVPTYAGSALPVSANATTEDDTITPAPLVFEAPKAANAA
jgi:hypothetical protein